MIVKQWTAQDLEQLRRRIVDEHERGLPSVAEGDEVLAVFEELDRQRARSAQLVDALAAVREAIGIPYAATAGGEAVRHRLLVRRAIYAEVMLDRVASGQDVAGLGWEIANLRTQLAGCAPVGYVTWLQAQTALAEGKTWQEATALPPSEQQADGDGR